MLDPAALRRSLTEDAPGAAAALRAALRSVPWSERDAWLDRLFELDPLSADGERLPRGCVPYLPCGVDAVLRVIDAAEVGAQDVFVDVGSGVGRVVTLVHCLTGAAAVGLEVQPDLVGRARALAAAWNKPRVRTLQGDAEETLRRVEGGTVFFLYCPFSGPRLDRALAHLEQVAATHPIRVASVDLPALDRPWLVRTLEEGGVCVYRSMPVGGDCHASGPGERQWR